MPPCLSWGAGTQGQLGNGTWQDSLQPTTVCNLRHLPEQGIMQVVCGANHAICLTDTQDVYVWGAVHFCTSSTFEQQRNYPAAQQRQEQGARVGASNAPQTNNITATTKSESTGDNVTVAMCCVPQVLALPVSGITIRRVAAGWQHTLFLSDSAKLFVAGDNHFGQLGLGQHVQATNQLVLLNLQQLPDQQLAAPAPRHTGASQGPAAVADEAAHSTVSSGHCSGAWVTDIAAGMRHSLALLCYDSPAHEHDDGDCFEHQPAVKRHMRECDIAGSTSRSVNLVVGWGSNRRQQLGPTDRLSALTCSCSSSSAALHAATAAAGEVSTSTHDQVRSSIVWQPSILTALHGVLVLGVAAGGERSAGITRQGRLLLWGRSLLGCNYAAAVDDAYTCLPQPRRCAMWLHGQNSNNSSSNSKDVLLQPSARGTGRTTAEQQSVSSHAPVAVIAGNQQHFGITATSDSAAASAGTNELTWITVCLGWRHLVALDSAGQVWSAGDNSLRQLGIGTHPQQVQQQFPVALAGKSTAPLVQQAPGMHVVGLPLPADCVAAGAEHSVAVLSDGSTWAWGWGEHGQLGTGSSDDEALPKQVVAIKQPTSDNHIAAPTARACGVDDNVKRVGSLTCRPHLVSWQPSGVACGSGFTVLW